MALVSGRLVVDAVRRTNKTISRRKQRGISTEGFYRSYRLAASCGE